MNATDLPSKANCHKGNSVLYTSKAGGRLTVGGATRHVEHLGLMVDLTNGQNAPGVQSILTGNKEGKAIASHLMALSKDALPYICMPIRDYGVPTWSTEVLKALALDVKFTLNNGRDVTIACTGGHGRSGMIAAILLQLLDPVKNEHPVTRLRRLHCANAIETAEQVRYVCDCTGFPFDKELVIERAPVAATTNSLVPTAYDDRWSKYVPGTYNKPTGAKPEPLVTRKNGSGKTVHLVQCSMCTEWFDPKTGEIRNDKYTYPDYKLDDDYPMCGGCDHWTTQEAAKRGKHPTENEPF